MKSPAPLVEPADSLDFGDLLQAVRAGRRFFTPRGNTGSALALFQNLARLLVRAAARGLLVIEGVVRSQGPDTPDWILAVEVSGITEQGAAYLGGSGVGNG